MRLDPAGRRRRPLVRVVARLVEGDGGGTRRAADHAEGLPQARAGVVGRGVERGQQLRQVFVQLFAPREGRGHAVDALRDRPEFVGLVFEQSLAEVASGDTRERRRHPAERRHQPAAVVPEAQPQHDHHGEEQHRRGERGLHRVVARVHGEIFQRGHLRGEHGGRREPLHPVEALGQLHHRRLSGARAAPRRDLRDQPDEGDGNEGRREQPCDARRRAHGAP